jgi:hypothetical protein
LTAWDWRRDKFIEHGLLDERLLGLAVRSQGGWMSRDDMINTLQDICQAWLDES